ncbi:hypothetical protein ZWY2020_005820 [Hordeum vulgare]|nr:hypothetical protein ZWY2020_005820 [Hordeum vulgare]
MLTSSVRSEMGSRSVVVSCIQCSQCGTRIKFHVSNTERHEGRVFYKCINHRLTCDFWYWELEYVVYLVENRYLEDNVAVDAKGAAEDRREELNRAANERASKRGSAGACSMQNGRAEKGRKEEWVTDGREQAWVPSSIRRQRAEVVVGLGKDIVMMFKALLASVILMCVLMALAVMKN